MTTISDAIGADHKDIDATHDKLVAAKDLQSKIEWRNQLVWRLARHAISEELTLYPAMEKHLGELGTKLTNEDRAQHQAVCIWEQLDVSRT
jgi:hemerythrin superfamily protein